MVGFVRVLGNPSVLLLWVTLSATFLAHDWVDQTVDDRISFVAGVASGAALWFVLLAWGVSRGHGRISPRVLLRMEHVSGAILLIAALVIGGRIIWHLHQQHQRQRARGEEVVLWKSASDSREIGANPARSSDSILRAKSPENLLTAR
jgi:hypothetical protein